MQNHLYIADISIPSRLWCILSKSCDIVLKCIFRAFFNAKLNHFLCIFDFLLYPCYSFDMALKNKAYRNFKAITCTTVDSYQRPESKLMPWAEIRISKNGHIFWGTRPTTSVFSSNSLSTTIIFVSFFFSTNY